MHERQQTIRNRVFFVLRLCVVAGACYLIFKNLNYQEFAGSFKQLKAWVIGVAVAVKFITESAMAFRWWILLRALGVFIPLKTALRLHFHGLFFSSFLPSSTGGDFIRAWYVTRHTEKRGLSALSVFVDRFAGLFSTALIAVVTFVFWFDRSVWPLADAGTAGQTISRFILISIVLSVLVLSAGLFWIVRKTPNRVSETDGFLVKIIQKSLLYTREIISAFFRKWWLFPVLISLTILFQSLTFISFWLIGMDLGVAGQLRHYFLFFPLVWVIGVIPVSIAGLGILEGGVVLLFVKVAGASPETAAALAVCQRALFLIVSIPGIFVHLRADYLPKTKEHIFIDGSE
ncbi:MAG: lysylphosphatidylglycerol synthase transmembrane domain-containing protein [Anaerohalosphaeraceae bacterium]